MNTDRTIRILRNLTILFAAGGIIFLMIIISLLYQKADAAAQPTEAEPAPAIETAAIRTPMPQLPAYTIWLSGQELRLTTHDAPETYTVLHSIDPRTLRSADRTALENGIGLDSREAVLQFLEDFSS